MVTKLIVASGKSAGRAITVKRDRLLIGRAEECDVRPLSEDVSRRHCAVIVGPAAVWVEDLRSRNGTFVNGRRIEGKVEVKHGDVIRVGVLELKVACSEPSSAGGSEDDVSRWLMSDDQPAGMLDTTRTMPSVAPGVTQIIKGDVPGVPADVAASDTAASSSSTTVSIDALKAGKGQPGALPQQPKQAAESSRHAAAEALKKFFDNR